MIVGIFGLPGSGKSLEATRRAALAHDQGDVHVYSNTPLAFTERYTFITSTDLVSLRALACPCRCARVFVLLDEVHLWLDSRRSMKLPSSWLKLFSQTRKRKWDLFYTAQHERRVDVVLKNVTEYMVLARERPLFGEAYYYQWFYTDGFRDPEFRLKKDWRRRSARVSALYNTDYEVDESAHLADSKDPYVAAAATGQVAPWVSPGVPGAGPTASSPVSSVGSIGYGSL